MLTNNSKRILLVQFADIGDLVLTTPAIAALRDARPNDQLTLLTSAHAAPLVPTELVNQVIALEKDDSNATSAFFRPHNLRQTWKLRRGGRYDAIVYFHHFSLRAGLLKFALLARVSGARRRYGLQNGRANFLTDSLPDGGFGAQHQAQYWLDLVSLLGADPAPRPAQVAIGESPLPPSKAPRIVIHPGSGSYSRARRWSPRRFAQVAARLREEFGAEIVFVGTAADIPHPPIRAESISEIVFGDQAADDQTALREALTHADYDLSGRTDLPQLAAVLRDASLVIGADSGVMHVAAAVGAPQLAIFGPSNHEAWAPWAPGARVRPVVLRSGVACSPCSYVGQSVGQRDGCAARTCMRLVATDQVLAAARGILRGESAAAPTKSTTLAPPVRSWPRLNILGLPLDGITYEGWLAQIEGWLKARDGLHHVCTLNPEFAIIAQRDANFRHILQRATLCVADGVGMLWAARRRGNPLPTRVTGADGLLRIAERAAERGWRLFFLGAAPGVGERAATALRARYPGLRIVGTVSGSPAPAEEDALVEQINASGAELLFVAFGAPIQDKWIARNSTRLNVTMAMGVGGAFDFVAGEIPRAPRWLRRLGLEWLFRLIRQPWRWRRMMRLPRFVLAVLREGAPNG